MTATPDPAAFAAAASRAAPGMIASVLSAHTAEEVMCGAAPGRPAAVAVALVAVALVVVAGELTAEDLVRSPSR